MAAEKIELSDLLNAMDRKDRDFYDNLPEHLKKKFSGFLSLQWMASVRGDALLEEYILRSTNKYANVNMFDLYHHPKLQWLMITAASPGFGSQRHQWIKRKPKPKDSNSAIKKELAQFFPNMKDDDLDTLAAITTKKELKAYARAHGND
jgi:hypothetical protein